ncbi:FAD/NAD(P)-binding domain-containing protein [Daedalea quercina L-15889]|uniref:FAD/NAD(P)-binding domain-containing protein n=1 Tax=Daedalea quercina L-15889 TaxID=1314783 RepID=A0A165NJT6_9APHY|nr:FAD/NAD(P)-binding domain-containing protein [Daedalea quercina L-15889]
MPYGASSMHRADLVQVLTRNVPQRYTTHYNKKLLFYDEATNDAGDVTHLVLHFEDGSMEDADVLIGADGIRSTVRGCMYDRAHKKDCGSDVEKERCARCKGAAPTWDGVVAYRTLVDTEKLRKLNPEHEAFRSTLCFAGKGRHVVTYPVSHGSFINMVGYDTFPGREGSQYEGRWSQAVTKEEMAKVYEGWEHELHQLFDCMDTPVRWVLNVVDGLPFCVTERVALLGDSMHAMESHLGSGAGQSIESAYILGRLLAHRLMTVERIPEILRIYQSIRLPYGHTIVRRAQETGKHCEFDAPGEFDGRECPDERERLEALGKKLAGQWSWQWREKFDDQWEVAEWSLEQFLHVEAQKAQARLLTSVGGYCP